MSSVEENSEGVQQSGEIDSVAPYEDGSDFGVHIRGAIGFGVRNPEALPLPTEGCACEWWEGGGGIGSPILGFAATLPNGVRHVYFRETLADYKARAAEERRLERERAQARWKAGLAEYERRLEELPEPFRARIRFFMRREQWGPRFGDYELFVCQEALKILAVVNTVEALARFHRASHEGQRALIPTLDYHNHSGNTFGQACLLARLYLAGPDYIPKAHGGLCPLVGCDEYGCYASTEEAAAARRDRSPHTVRS